MLHMLSYGYQTSRKMQTWKHCWVLRVTDHHHYCLTVEITGPNDALSTAVWQWAIRTKSLVSDHSICTQTFRLRRGKTACGVKDRKIAQRNTQSTTLSLSYSCYHGRPVPRDRTRGSWKCLETCFFNFYIFSKSQKVYLSLRSKHITNNWCNYKYFNLNVLLVL